VGHSPFSLAPHVMRGIAPSWITETTEITRDDTDITIRKGKPLLLLPYIHVHTTRARHYTTDIQGLFRVSGSRKGTSRGMSMLGNQRPTCMLQVTVT
jgi:hypothetical protein